MRSSCVQGRSGAGGRCCETSDSCKCLQEVELPSDRWLTPGTTMVPSLLRMMGLRHMSLSVRCNEFNEQKHGVTNEIGMPFDRKENKGAR